ncbi:ATP-grasp domain-containing protein [Actinokineospora sp. HUAS TT18]|uniref:ATP-grasp domain-containing protein n=1 Tax=Actinokineospora sp. HUAS TT18 TaxID=3447451 RepID=UPI003F51F431
MSAAEPGELERAMTPVVMYWIRSERESKSPALDYSEMLERYAAAFESLRVDLRWVSVDDIVIGRTAAGPAVSVRGERLDPSTAFFHTMLMSSPANRIDAWRHLTTYAGLEAAGFFVTVPPTHSILNNDKVLTGLQDFPGPVRRLPTIRVCTRGYRGFDADTLVAAGIDFPVIIKPIDWDGGNSVFLARDTAEIDEVLSWAAPAELTMAVQHWAGPDKVDYRVFCVDGEPCQALERRATNGGIAGNHRQGGSELLGDVPDVLIEPSRAIAAVFGLPYLCVDFLVAGDEWWLSEVETDGGAPGVPLAQIRFNSYRKRFDEFVARSAGRTWRYTGGQS